MSIFVPWIGGLSPEPDTSEDERALERAETDGWHIREFSDIPTLE